MMACDIDQSAEIAALKAERGMRRMRERARREGGGE
jgi:hypothetical protein